MKRNQRLSSTVVLTLLFSGLFFSVINSSLLLASPKKPKLSEAHEDFYHYARYLFTKDERKIFFNLPDDQSRDEFIDYFWKIRDPNPYNEENEFKTEIERRYEFVNHYVKEGPVPGWKTDRGRVYILLGPPSNTYEQIIDQGFAREIWWYYEESEIYVRFTDPSGSGIFRMDLRNTSLRLLDEMELRKYYIVNKDEKEEFFTGIMNFKLAYDKTAKEILITIDTKHLDYEKETENNIPTGLMIAKIRVNLVIYKQDNRFSQFTQVLTQKIPQDELLEKKNLTLRIPMELPTGKLKIDAIVSDFIGDAVQRKLVKVKN